jgi:ribulose-phosphate 3-epimerase
MVKIAPSILAANPLRLLDDLKLLEAAGVDLIHVDVIDGVFAPNFGYTPDVVRAIASETKTPIDVHLMIVNPLKYVAVFAEAGATYISVHVEALHPSSAKALLHLSREYGFKYGLALRPSTPEPTWLNDLLEEVHFVLPMSVEPGFSGQKFIEAVFSRFKLFSEKRLERHLNFELEADGGVTPDNVARLVENGADILVAGSSIFSSSNVTEALRRLRTACKVYSS